MNADSQTQRFRHTDHDLRAGHSKVRELLGFVPDGELAYDASFSLDGTGAFDKCGVTFRAKDESWRSILSRIGAGAPEDAACDPGWSEDFLWLIEHDEPEGARAAAIRFINDERFEFQRECLEESEVFFGWESDVNDWVVVWESNGIVNFMSFSQG